MNTMISNLGSLVIFRNLLELPYIKSLIKLWSIKEKNASDVAFAYGEFMSEVIKCSDNFSSLLLDSVLDDENLYTKYISANNEENALYENLLLRELEILQKVSLYDGSDIRCRTELSMLPVWNTSEYDFVSFYKERIAQMSTKGFGIYAKHHMFVLDVDGKIIPIKKPDPMLLSDLVGYERERTPILQNTEAFLEGKAANNVLLYGDAGTGKSSTVKAIANSYCDRGIRLIEIKKDQLTLIPKIIEQISDNPLKFIFFIDDLTFTSDDRDFCTLKATLEGGVCSRGSNIIIYATSNHRHMIKESASGRQDSVNVADSIQETVSLSSRFGITVTYLKADRNQYAMIVCELAKRAGIVMDENDLIVGAEAFAIRGGGRNPRTAKQYIDMLGTKLD